MSDEMFAKDGMLELSQSRRDEMDCFECSDSEVRFTKGVGQSPCSMIRNIIHVVVWFSKPDCPSLSTSCDNLILYD